MGFADKLGDTLAKRGGLVVIAFLGLLVLSVPVITGAQAYISIYELSPRGEYYDHFRTLNGEMGWDNLGAVLLTNTDEHEGENITRAGAVRMMNDVELALEKLDFVEGAYSLAEIVRIMNDRPRFVVEQYRQDAGLPALPGPLQSQIDERSGFPEEGEAGDARIEASIDLALDLLGDQIYGNILHEDHRSALLVVVMEKGATGPEYRQWQNQLKTEGLALEDSVDHAGQLEMRPLSIDIIYSTLDDVTFEESPDWILTAILAATATMLFLFRRFTETSFGLLVLVIVAAGTLSAALSLGIDFNLLSLMVATLIFAAGVDYAMHVIARYREERRLGFDAKQAATTTIKNTGPALLITTVTDTAGFATLYFSLIPAIGRFGLMVAAGMFLSFITCLTLLPALLMMADRIRGEAEGADVDDHVLEERRLKAEHEVRTEQKESMLGRLGMKLADHPAGVMLAFTALLLVAAAPLVTEGVDAWGGSYLEPSPILENDTYAMQSLQRMDETFGIPNEMAVLFYGDATDPDVVQYLDAFQQATNQTHGITKIDSVPNMLRLYTTIINPDPSIDQDQDGLPDTQAQIKQAYDEMRNDPATKVLLDRVVVYEPGAPVEYPIAAHRLGIDPQPPDTLGEDVANYRATLNDIEENLTAMSRAENQAGLEHGTTGLVELGVEVVDAIIRGNAATMAIMLGVVFALLSMFWKSPAIGAIGTIPVLFGVTVQYGLGSLLGYEITYVSLILTGMVMGIGVDDAVHFITRFREEIRRGTEPHVASGLANAEVGSVLVGTTLTTISPFVVVLFSVVTWATQTATLVIPTLLAALFGTLIPLPALLAWHADRHPEAYHRGTVFDERLPLPSGEVVIEEHPDPVETGA